MSYNKILLVFRFTRNSKVRFSSKAIHNDKRKSLIFPAK